MAACWTTSANARCLATNKPKSPAHVTKSAYHETNRQTQLRGLLMKKTAEGRRLDAHSQRKANWKNWGPYLSERAWGTVREDYSANGAAWEYFPHDQARSRTYRWNEDGLAGISDRGQYL